MTPQQKIARAHDRLAVGSSVLRTRREDEQRTTLNGVSDPVSAAERLARRARDLWRRISA